MVPIFGSESIEVLHKKRELNKTHIEKSSKRFRISPAVFYKTSMQPWSSFALVLLLVPLMVPQMKLLPTFGE